MSGRFPIVSGVYSENLTNEGVIEIEGDGSNGRGVQGTIINAASGSIFRRKLDKGLPGEGSNSATILVEQCDRGIEFSHDFVNESGAEIRVRNSVAGLLIQDGVIENRNGALISIKKSGDYGLPIPQPFASAGYLFSTGLIEIDPTSGIGILSSNDIHNQDGGVINVSNSHCHTLSENAVLVNEGAINVVKSAGTGLFQEVRTLNNEGSGQIIIDGSL